MCVIIDYTRIFFEVGIPNLVSGWILVLGSVTYHFWVAEHISCFNPKFGNVDASWDDGAELSLGF